MILQCCYLVHGEVPVVEVAGASLETNLSHAVVNQEEIPQLQETQSHKHALTIELLRLTNKPPKNVSAVTHISQLLIRLHRDSWLAQMLTRSANNWSKF